MDSKIRILWWNVHKLQDSAHAERIVSRIKEVDPDIFGLGEVIGEPAYKLIAQRFPEHNFYMSYGPQAQELLVGARRTLQAFFSQKTEFKSGNAFVRPAVLVTINDAESPLNILFAHPKSFASPSDFGQRDDFFQRVFALKSLLDKMVQGDARFIVCGDMNTMGMSYLERDFIKADDELHNLSTEAGNVGLLLKEKSSHGTWAGKYRPNKSADLDHVIASDSVEFVKQKDGSERLFEVKVGGWADYPIKSAERADFIENVSDHCFLSFEVQLSSINANP